VVRNEAIDCDFSRLDGYLFLAEGDKQATLERELDAAHRAGLKDVTLQPRAPYQGWDTGPCLRFPRQGQFHPLKYLGALAAAVRRAGGRIYCNSHADHVESGVPALVHVGNHVVTGDALVVATNVPINNRLTLHTKQAPYMTYVIGARVPRGSVPTVLSWDTGDPYHYIRIQPYEEDDLLIVGGEDHKSGQAHDSPARVPVKAAGEFAREDLNMAAQYADWLTPGDVKSADDIARDSGAIVRRGLEKLAVYRDENGALHERLAACPHLGCIVRWNPGE